MEPINKFGQPGRVDAGTVSHRAANRIQIAVAGRLKQDDVGIGNDHAIGDYGAGEFLREGKFVTAKKNL